MTTDTFIFISVVIQKVIGIITTNNKANATLNDINNYIVLTIRLTTRNFIGTKFWGFILKGVIARSIKTDAVTEIPLVIEETINIEKFIIILKNYTIVVDLFSTIATDPVSMITSSIRFDKQDLIIIIHIMAALISETPSSPSA